MHTRRTTMYWTRGVSLGLLLCLTACGAETAKDAGSAVSAVSGQVVEMQVVNTGQSEAGAGQTETDAEEAETYTGQPEDACSRTETDTEETDTEETDAEETEVCSEQDVTPPVISGIHDLTVERGGTISYKKGVSVVDDSGEDIELKVDASAVNLNAEGVYEVIYRAEDSAGNSTEVKILVTVTEPAPVTEEEVYALADEIIAGEITEEMTQYQKAEALWKWCRYNITYSYSAGERTVLGGAYEGMHGRLGDCYVYYATYEVLLTRCGIENMCVSRVGGASNHWWNLVNVGSGWYHCDTSPRYKEDQFVCFMQTDEQIAAYSDYYLSMHPGHPNYYGFDGTLYPERATVIVVENQIPQTE